MHCEDPRVSALCGSERATLRIAAAGCVYGSRNRES